MISLGRFTQTFTWDDVGENRLDVEKILNRFAELRDRNADEDDELDVDEAAELAQLEKLEAELRGCGGDVQFEGNWYPAQLILVSHFVEYTREYCEDVYGDELRDSKFPFNHIDWEAAADELSEDYSTIELWYLLEEGRGLGNSVIYYYR